MSQDQVQKTHSKNLEGKKYFCEPCDIVCRSNFELQRHYNTKKHERVRSGTFKNYHCELCDHTYGSHTQLEIHKNTKKHINAKKNLKIY